MSLVKLASFYRKIRCFTGLQPAGAGGGKGKGAVAQATALVYKI